MTLVHKAQRSVIEAGRGLKLKSKNLRDIINKLSRGEICVANFIPPGNGASLGGYFSVVTLKSDTSYTSEKITPYLQR